MSIKYPQQRPVYETKGDKKRERGAIHEIKRVWGVEASKAKELWHYDYTLIINNKRIGIAEVKNRLNNSSKYETYMISKSKYDKCLGSSAYYGVPFYIFVGFTDGIKYYEHSFDHEHFVSLGGRQDRGDEKDIEECYFIDMIYFKDIEER